MKRFGWKFALIIGSTLLGVACRLASFPETEAGDRPLRRDDPGL